MTALMGVPGLKGAPYVKLSSLSDGMTIGVASLFKCYLPVPPYLRLPRVLPPFMATAFLETDSLTYEGCLILMSDSILNRYCP